MSSPHTWTPEKIFWQSCLFIVYNSCNDVSQLNLVHLFCIWKLAVPSLAIHGVVRSVDCPVWLFAVEVAGEEAVWILVIPCMSGTEGCDRRGVPGRYLRRVTDSSTRPVMYQHTHDSANEGRASEAHLSVSPCSVSPTLFVCVVSTHQHFKWWEACGNGKAKHAYWVNEARSEASPFVKYGRRRKHQWQKWVEWERASRGGDLRHNLTDSQQTLTHRRRRRVANNTKHRSTTSRFPSWTWS